jgi:hypothetical protein
VAGRGDADLAVERALSSLIRAEETVHTAPPERCTPEIHTHPAEADPKLADRPAVRLRVLGNAAGMLLALGVIAALFVWFTRLPDSAATGYWSRLANQEGTPAAAGTRELDDNARRSDAGDSDARPFGRFDFGPPVTAPLENGWTTSRAGLAGFGEGVGEGVGEGFGENRSIQALEAAFEASYVPPPECYNWTSRAQMAACGNHRMRARRVFIDSGGRTFDSALYGDGSPPMTRGAPHNWRAEQRWRESQTERAQTWGNRPIEVPDAWPGAQTRQPMGHWDAEALPSDEGDWRSDWRRRDRQHSSGDWRSEWLERP